MLDKSLANPEVAVADVRNGASIAVGGFGLSGNPTELINAVLDSGVEDLHVVSNNCGVDGQGLGVLLAAHRIRKITASYVGENKEFERQFLSGELEVELTPQHTGREAAGRRRGHPGVLHPHRGRDPGGRRRAAPTLRRARRGAQGQPAEGSAHHRLCRTRGAVRAGTLHRHRLCLVHAALGDTHGNLIFNKAAQQFSVPAAMAGRICVAQVERLVQPGELDPAQVHLPGVFVHRIVEVGEQHLKPIERRTTRAK